MSETTKAQDVKDAIAIANEGYQLGYDAGYRQALEDAAKLICPNCEKDVPLKNPGQWTWNHEVPGIGIGPCYSAAIHDTIRALGGCGL